jgi:hypothetical protein
LISEKGRDLATGKSNQIAYLHAWSEQFDVRIKDFSNLYILRSQCKIFFQSYLASGFLDFFFPELK